MFLRYLQIENVHGLIRRIDFHQGLNLIVDEVSTDNEETGNNVGKTTVLRLIDFCFGMEGNKIYTSTEGPKVVNKEVKEFLMETEVLITLCLADGFTENAKIGFRGSYTIKTFTIGKPYNKAISCALLLFLRRCGLHLKAYTHL